MANLNIRISYNTHVFERPDGTARVEVGSLASGLTETRIAATFGDPKRPARLELADGAESGLRLRINGGSAQWSVLTRGADAERVRLPLGAWPSMGVDQARKVAGALKGALAGVAASDGDEMSLGAILARYKDRRLSQLRKGAVMARALETTLAPLKSRPMTEVTRREIGFVIDELADRAPIHGNRVLAYTKAFFNWAVGRGYIEQSAAAAITKPSRERTRERTPSLTEVAEIWSVAGGLGYPFGPIVRLLILTAARRNEAGAMRVAELNLDDGPSGAIWTIPADRSKNGRSIRTPLAPLARRVLEEALGARQVDGEYVFTTNARSPVSGWSRAKTRLDALLAASRVERGEGPFEPWRFHDLRRSFATHACDVLHIDPVVVDRCLNHVGASTTSTVSRIYARNELFDQRSDALTRWAALFEQAN
jgi:integrase